MSQFVSWLITEKPRSTVGHFLNDSLNGVMYASLILSILLIAGR